MSEQEIQERALSGREEEVAMLAAEGLTDKEIADRLGLSPGTLRTYWERTRAKLGAKTRSHAIAKLLKARAERHAQPDFEQMRLFFTCAAEVALVSTDAKGMIQIWNPGVQRLLGYSEEEWVGKHLSIIYTEEQIAAHKPEQEMAHCREFGPINQDGWHRRKDGTIFWARGTLFPLWDSVILGYGKVLSDGSDMDALQRSFDEVREQVGKLLKTDK